MRSCEDVEIPWKQARVCMSVCVFPRAQAWFGWSAAASKLACELWPRSFAAGCGRHAGDSRHSQRGRLPLWLILLAPSMLNRQWLRATLKHQGSVRITVSAAEERGHSRCSSSFIMCMRRFLTYVVSVMACFLCMHFGKQLDCYWLCYNPTARVIM